MVLRLLVRSALQIAVHAALVLALCGGPLQALLFLVAGGLLVFAKSAIPQRWRPPYVLFGSLALAGLALSMRGSFGDLGLVFLGVSYAFLRMVRALAAQERWSVLAFLRYYFFFPTFFSGPVLEPSHLAAGRSDLRAGLLRIIEGVIRVGASHLLSVAIPLGSPRQLTFALDRWELPGLWLGAFASGVWLYLDFSGYSAIYIGLARCFGVRAPENFDRPFAAADITAFWQRWHISLGDWLRSSVYTPLARALVSRSPKLAALVAPIATMVICGAWHEIAGSFLLWGLLHGIALAAHALWRRLSMPRERTWYRAASWLATHAFVAMTWTLFLPLDAELALRARALSRLFGG